MKLLYYPNQEKPFEHLLFMSNAGLDKYDNWQKLMEILNEEFGPGIYLRQYSPTESYRSRWAYLPFEIFFRTKEDAMLFKLRVDF